MSEHNYYALEIVDPKTVTEVKNAYLLRNSQALTLLENLLCPNEQIEFSGIMRFNPEAIKDELEQNIGHDDNIIEITSIRKVRI